MRPFYTSRALLLCRGVHSYISVLHQWVLYACLYEDYISSAVAIAAKLLERSRHWGSFATRSERKKEEGRKHQDILPLGNQGSAIINARGTESWDTTKRVIESKPSPMNRIHPMKPPCDYRITFYFFIFFMYVRMVLSIKCSYVFMVGIAYKLIEMFKVEWYQKCTNVQIFTS